MVFLKKSFFGVLFLIFFFIFLGQLSPLFQSPTLIFSLDLGVLIQLLVLSLLLILASLFFVIFVTLASDWRLVIGLTILGAILPVILFSLNIASILGLGVIFSVGFVYPLLQHRLATYLTFQPTVLLSPAVKNLASLFLVVIAFGVFLISNSEIKQNGFKVPDSFIDSAMSFIPNDYINETQTEQPLPEISKEQIELLKQNPDLLKQYGLNSETLDKITEGQQKKEGVGLKDRESLMRNLLKNQINSYIEPYTSWIPLVLGLSLFVSLYSLISLVSILISPFLWLIFYLLEKTGFISFQKEMREVRKLVV